MSPAASRAPVWWRSYVLDVIADTERESVEYEERVPAGQATRRVVVVMLAATLSLTFIHFVRAPQFVVTLANVLGQTPVGGPITALADAMRTGPGSEFTRVVWWAVVSVFGYVAIPLLAIRFLGGRMRDFGAAPAPWRMGRPYLVLYGLSAPFLIMASFLPSFQATYPFYGPAAGEPWWPRVAVFWALYIIQFVAVEFFFRGFMLFGLAPRLGIASVFVMVIPYTMIHFSKPFAEALSAVLGGSVLGFLALKAGSFWWAAGLHIGIAMTMEVLALWHVGFF